MVNSAKRGSCKRLPGRTFENSVRLALILLSLALPVFAHAQQSGRPQLPDQVQGTISGTVVDGTGAEIVGARVTLVWKDQSATQEALSNSEGQFSFANVVPGDLEITITAKGFAPRTSSVTLHPGETYTVPTTELSPATASTVVQVSPSTNYQLADEQIKVQEKQRIVGFFPNFYISYEPDAVPLAPKQKFKLAWKSSIDPVTFVLTGATAGVQQAQNDFSGYGQGGAGYAKRFGASYADNVIDTMLEGAILPSLLKQDPRYFYKGTGSTGSRLLYAIGNLVICKGDNKRWQPNYSGILGGLAAGGISNLYYPEQDRGAALTFDNALIGMGTAAAVNILQEFVIRKFTKNAPKADSSGP